MATSTAAAFDPDVLDLDIDMDYGDAPISNAPAVNQDPVSFASNGDLPYDDDDLALSNRVLDSQSAALVLNKVLLSGVDELSTGDIQKYCRDNQLSPLKVEWINDSSVNLVFESEEQSGEALCTLTGLQIADLSTRNHSELRSALPFSSEKFSNIPLQARIATELDVKKPRAHLQSRYYLLHPDEDPEELRLKKQEEYRRTRHPNRDDDRRRGQRSSSRNSHYSSGSVGKGSPNSRRSLRRRDRSLSPGRSVRQGRRNWREDKDDLFSSSKAGRQRDRSKDLLDIEEDDLLAPSKPLSRLDAMFAEREDRAHRDLLPPTPPAPSDDLLASTTKASNDIIPPASGLSVKHAAKRPPAPLLNLLATARQAQQPAKSKTGSLESRVKLAGSEKRGDGSNDNGGLSSRVVLPGGANKRGPLPAEDLFGPQSGLAIRGLAAAKDDLIISGSAVTSRGGRRPRAKAQDFH